MPIANEICNTFKTGLATALHNFTVSTGNDFRLGLIRGGHTGTYGQASTNYSQITANSDEATVTNGTGYTAGGQTLTNITPVINTNKALVDFNHPTGVVWTITETTPPASLSVDGCFIQNFTASGAMVSIFTLAAQLNPTGPGATLTINMPAVGQATSLIRLA